MELDEQHLTRMINNTKRKKYTVVEVSVKFEKQDTQKPAKGFTIIITITKENAICSSLKV